MPNAAFHDRVLLPHGLSGDKCTLGWFWWGMVSDGTFIACADIKILPSIECGENEIVVTEGGEPKCEACEEGWVAINNECIDPNAEVECRDNQIRDVEENVCITCDVDEVVEDNQCKTCKENEIIENFACKACPEEYIVEDNQCVDPNAPPPPAAGDCGPNSIEIGGGHCVPCPPGTVAYNNQCVHPWDAPDTDPVATAGLRGDHNLAENL